MSEGGDKCFLYEAEHSGGMIYLTIDDTSPVFIGFHHKIKVEVKINPVDKQPPARVSRQPQQTGDGETLQVVTSTDTSNSKSGPVSQIMKGTLEIKQEIHDIAESFITETKINDQKGRTKASDLYAEHEFAHTRRTSKRKGAKGKKKSELITRTAGKIRKKTGSNREKNHAHEDLQTPYRMGRENHRTRVSCENNSKCATEGMEGLSNDEADAESETTLMEEKTVSCEYCLQVFESRRAFYDHRRSKSETYECSECNKTFAFRGHLLVHMRDHRSGKGDEDVSLKRAVCDVCGLDSKNVTRLKKHMLIHTGEFYYKCCVCDKKISGFGAMNNHMVSHKSAGMIKCNCCDQYFSTRAELSKHQLALLDIKCKLCGDVFPNRTSRTVHYKLAHPDNILRCHICNHMFSSQEELTNHMVYHTKYKKKQCTTCGKFVSRLEKHILTHKSFKDIDESDLFICDKCPMKFMLKSSLQRHQRTHSQERPFECYHCPKTFSCRSVLLKHIKSHSSVMPYECDVCGKRCKEKSNLKVHMRAHSDTKAFPCSLCAQAFGYKNSLEAHMKSKHSSVESTLILKHDLDQSNNLVCATRPVDNGKHYTSVDGNVNNYSVLSCEDKDYTQMSRSAGNFTETLLQHQQEMSHIDLLSNSHTVAIDERSLSACIFPIDPRLAMTSNVYSRAHHPS